MHAYTHSIYRKAFVHAPVVFLKKWASIKKPCIKNDMPIKGIKRNKCKKPLTGC